MRPRRLALGPMGYSRCSHKFAIMQMPRSSRVRGLALGSLLYGTGVVVNAMVAMENATRNARLEEHLCEKRKREKRRKRDRSASRYYRPRHRHT